MPDPSSLPEIVIAGYGAVTPFGWGKDALSHGLGGAAEGEVGAAPAPPAPQPWHKHPRLRRTSPIAKYVVAVGLEALGHPDAPEAAADAAPERLGIILCIQNGCVNFSKRFYGEVLDTPGFASPILFPETVFNSPASHLAAILGRTTINYTLIGDAAAFIQGMALATEWLRERQVDGALVIAAEEEDALTTAAYKIFHPEARVTCGAGAVYLRRQEDAPATTILLGCLTDSRTFADLAGRETAAQRVTADLMQVHALSGGVTGKTLLVADSSVPEWPGERFSPRALLGDGLSASGAWQFVSACSHLEREDDWESALVPVIGAAEQAAGVFLYKSI